MKTNIGIIVATAFLLFLFGFLGISFLTGFGLLDYWKQKLLVIVELKDDLTEEDFNALQVQLETAQYVVSNSLNIITKEEAADLMKQDLGNEFLSLEMDNPLHNVYTFNVQQQNATPEKLAAIRAELRENNAVFDVFYEENISKNMSKNVSNFLFYAVGLSILFIFVAVFMIRQHLLLMWNTQKESVLEAEDRETSLAIVKQQQLIRSFKNAVWSGAIAVFGLILFQYWLAHSLAEITTFVNNTWIILFFCSLLIVSVLAYLGTTFFLQKKQLIDVY